jgi:membrane protein DedA with SNARE-associated domain
MNPLDHLPPLPTGPALYLVVIVVVICSSIPLVGMVVAAEPILMAVVVLTGANYVTLGTLAVSAVAAAAAGDALAYALGRWFAPKLLRFKAVRRSRRHIISAQQIVARRGMLGALVIQRWIVPTRGFVPLLLGVARQPFGPFLACSIGSAAVWAVVFIVGSHLGGPKLIMSIATVVLVLTLARFAGRFVVRIRKSRSQARSVQQPF